jgi:hypothetical protein
LAGVAAVLVLLVPVVAVAVAVSVLPYAVEQPVPFNGGSVFAYVVSVNVQLAPGASGLESVKVLVVVPFTTSVTMTL